MLAYANRNALELTLQTGEMHFFSRSRDEIWRKGETSGATMALKQLRYDCDGDAVLAIVTPAGPACHTGERTCFYREFDGGGMSRGPVRGAAGARAHAPQPRRPSVPRAPTRSSCSTIRP